MVQKPRDIGVHGRCDGMGDLTPLGSHLKLNLEGLGDFVISEGAGEVLAAELKGALAAGTKEESA